MTINLIDVKKYYKDLPHQKIAVTFLHDILLTTPAKDRLGLTESNNFITLSDEHLEWLQRQLSGTKTLNKFAQLWRADPIDSEDSEAVVYNLFSQRDNSILPLVTCSSSSHAMYANIILKQRGEEGLNSDEEYLKKVFSGRYNHIGTSKNKSVYWDIHNLVLEEYGINSKYIWDGDIQGLKDEVKKNGASVINIFHKGTSRSNRGGGHIVVATKFFDDNSVEILDPFGERPPHYNLKNVGSIQSSRTPRDNEYETLHRLVLCEARGEGVLGMALVARATLNRVNLTKRALENFMTRKATIESIVYAPNQYEPTWSVNNNIDTIYSRTSQKLQDDAHEAIQLATDPEQFQHELIKSGYKRSEAKTIVRSTFFAAKSHPRAISPYVHRIVTVGKQICGEGKNTVNVPDNIMFMPYEFKPGKKETDLVGQYVMSSSEFSWRFSGCWRQLLED